MPLRRLIPIVLLLLLGTVLSVYGYVQSRQPLENQVQAAGPELEG